MSKPKKLLTILGTRPQFVKAAGLSREIIEHNKISQNKIKEIILHTGQHYDKNMSEVFFNELSIPLPDIYCNVSKLSHGSMTGRMMEKIEKAINNVTPDCVLVYGDTNSTLAGALASVKLNIPIIHVEAGIRSFNKTMPEEINRVITDRVSTHLFCPSLVSVRNLKREGIKNGVHNVGDIMLDVYKFYKKIFNKINILSNLNLLKNNYILITIHRENNTNSKTNLKNILSAINKIAIDQNVVFPIHPRTLKYIKTYKLESLLDKIKVIKPLSYFEMMNLQMNSNIVITDSGGIQKEAFFNKVPCITVRDDTEWPETIDLGWNVLTEPKKDNILDRYSNYHFQRKIGNPYGFGKTAKKILRVINQL